MGVEDGVNQNAEERLPISSRHESHHPLIFLHGGTEISTTLFPRYSATSTSLLISLELHYETEEMNRTADLPRQVGAETGDEETLPTQ